MRRPDAGAGHPPGGDHSGAEVLRSPLLRVRRRCHGRPAPLAETVPGEAGRLAAEAGPDGARLEELPGGGSEVPPAPRAHRQPAARLHSQGIPADSQRLGRRVREGGRPDGAVPGHDPGGPAGCRLWDVPGVFALQAGAAGKASHSGGPVLPLHADLLRLRTCGGGGQLQKADLDLSGVRHGPSAGDQRRKEHQSRRFGAVPRLTDRPVGTPVNAHAPPGGR